MLLDLQVTTAGPYTVVEVGGQIDIASAAELRECLRQAIQEGARRLVVDLSRVEFIDSEGLGVLVGARRMLQQAHHDSSVQLVCTDGMVLRVLVVTGLDRVFPVRATLAEALDGERPTPAPPLNAAPARTWGGHRPSRRRVGFPRSGGNRPCGR
jgi:anti-sigma B factor antagonist